MSAVQVYPNVQLDGALFLTSPPDGTGRLFIVEQPGRVRVLPSNDNASIAPTFLDVSGEIATGFEQGLHGLAFDPGFATNRRLYVSYVARGATCQSGAYCTKIVRYEASASDPSQADVATRFVLLEIPRFGEFHNGGMVAFGPDGKLYISQGENGIEESSQDLSSLLGKILRIDVSGASGYTVPPDNPFVGQAGARGEIWVYGLRNPWRFSFDRLTGDLWIGDVGASNFEEVDFLLAGTPGGANFGWPNCEGTHDYNAYSCSSISSTPPILEYPHDGTGGGSISGGYVYRGDRLPALFGAYLYGDWVSQRIWARATLAGPSIEIAGGVGITSFGEGGDGEVYLVNELALYRLEENGNPGGEQFPTTLSATGLFSSVASLTPAPGLVEYEVNSPLWSDRALKRRWLALPGSEQIGFSASEDWSYPIGTVFVKHFELPTGPTTRRRVETRVFLRQVDRWVGYTYRWDAGETDATLLTTTATDTFTVDVGGVPTQQTWSYPSPAECLGCHTAAAGRVLGARTVQLNRSFAYGSGADNQLHAWSSCLSLFSKPIESASFYPAAADPANNLETIGARARSYLAANCAHCHRPGGPAPGGLDLRFEPLLGGMNLIGVAPTEGNLGIVGAERIRVGSKAQSVLWERVRSTTPSIRMPAGSLVPDPLAESLLGAWIDSGLGVLDSDGDAIADGADNCAYESNATQGDAGGWLSSTRDGIGDACQCGNVDALGVVNLLDRTRLRQYLSGNTGVAAAKLERRSAYTDAAGRPSILDLTHLRRAFAGSEAPLAQICPAATRLEP